MNDALAQLNPLPPHALVDGRPVKTLRVPQTAIVKGDARSYSIAAASVLAKVTRDRLMLEFHAQFPEYGFAEHKGYGTAKHLAAIAKHGACPIHRMTFRAAETTGTKTVLATDGHRLNTDSDRNCFDPCLIRVTICGQKNESVGKTQGAVRRQGKAGAFAARRTGRARGEKVFAESTA